MHKIRLLERLSALEDPGLTDGAPPDRQLRESVVQHLRRLLNTRAGSVPIDPGYGMPDMSNIAGSFALGTTEFLSEALIRQVSRYEPRLTDPRIEVEKENRDVITLRFALSGYVASGRGEAKKEPLAMTLRINATGQVFIEARNDR
ncbi:MAG: type VI secretion system baseplate subunit TssE [Alcaligenaceae bacterium]|nr:type VI secretion system baseplate subunit TssE [Alcaligenaceae bacterium]